MKTYLIIVVKIQPMCMLSNYFSPFFKLKQSSCNLHIG